MGFKEKRRIKRRHLLYYLPVNDAESLDLLGHLADITIEGIMLVGDMALVPGRTYELNLALPKDAFEKTELRCTARCAYCRKDVNPSLYASGFEIKQIAAEDRVLIRALIRKIGFND